MYLKSIEVHGFKSFANKILFEFHDGITGIVGPNGSGKSNVADAVRWVLGEQSAKQLRGARMEDVIFSGTETRKPLGFAYVAITLDNSDHKLPIDYEEVTIARRVYRSGESEYLINGSNCRLRDVQELFLDTGIGKEGYSIIGQGQIDRILSTKPEDRRELFDEAAGITKFKKRKHLAEKNLEAERLNLSRITDILSEIEKQIGPLEKQSEVAKEYLKLRDDLKGHEVTAFIEEYENFQTERDRVENNLATVTTQLETTERQYEEIRAEYERLEGELEQKNQEIDACNTLIADTRLAKEKLEGSMKVLQEQIIAVRQNDEHYKERIETAQNRLAEQKQEKETFLKQQAAMEEELASLEGLEKEIFEKIQELNQEISELEVKAEAAQLSLYDSNTRYIEHKTNIENQEYALEQSNIKKIALNQRVLKNKSDESLWEESRISHQAEADEIQEEAAKVRGAMEAAERSLKMLTEQEQQMRQQLEQARQDQVREQSRLDSLKNLSERYEGYGNSIRRIMEQKDRNPGIIGVVADIIQVKKDYETAIETALGGSIQNIVTDSEDTAKKMIQYLKQNKAGRATFLPLTAMKPKNEQRRDQLQVLSETGVIGMASTLVETESRFDGLVEHLLGRIVVVDHIDHAIALAKKYRYTLRIVTVEGEQLNPGGSLSGGSYRNNSNLLGRKREMDELQEKLDSLKEICAGLRQKTEELGKEKEKQAAAVSLYQKEMQELFLKLNTVKMQLSQDMERLEEVHAQYTEITFESNTLDREILEQKETIEQLRSEMSSQADTEETSRKEMEQCRYQIGELNAKKAEWNEKLAAKKLEQASQEQGSQYVLENLKRVQNEIERLEQELAELTQISTGSAEAVHQKEEQIREEQRQAEDAETLIRQTGLQRDELNQIRQRMNETHRNFFNKREALAEQKAGLDKEIFRLNTQKDRLSDQLDHQVNYIWEEYELTYSAAKREREAWLAALQESGDEIREWSTTARKRHISEVKGKIKALGPVNVNAIEDFRNMYERYILLSTQKEDVVQAEQVLQGVIEELDAEMRRQFEEKFAQIRTQFDLVFKELFGGGKGTLELIEDEDILEAGIRVIAQPPGKKLQNMMQLSGGEKALTAISLLFAIQNLKPSPFCLLDEIEAALDDSNVVRFANYLHKLTKNTQYIVITHRRGTMNAADILYGITMQEKGVSTLVSVNLVEDSVK